MSLHRRAAKGVSEPHRWRVFEDAVAYRFATGQSVPRIRRLYRVRRVEVEQALRGYMNRRTGK